MPFPFSAHDCAARPSRPPSRRTSGLHALLAGLASAVLLAACGGSGRGSDQAAATATTAAPRLLASASAARAAVAADYTVLLQRVYLAYFGRPADPAGLAYYAAGFAQAGAPTALAGLLAAYASNPTVKGAIDGFGSSAESQALYPGNNAAFITAVYANLFNRAPDAAGRAYWAGLLDSGAMTRGSAALAIMNGAQGSDSAIIDLKTAAASTFTAALNTSLRSASYDGLAANAVARTLLAQVGPASDPATFGAGAEAAITTLGAALATPGVYLLAGTAAGAGALDGAAADARFNFYGNPGGVLVDPAGNIYVADTQNGTVRKITPAGLVSTVAGVVGRDISSGGVATETTINRPHGLAMDKAGNLYVAANSSVRKITPAGEMSRFAANQSGGFHIPSGLCIDADGNLYVADQATLKISKITPQAVVSVVAGGAGTGGNVDGVGAAAAFNAPGGLAIDTHGVLYVADTGNQTIRRIGPGGAVTTIAGVPSTFDADGVVAVAPVDGAGAQARFSAPRAIAVDAAGVLYVADGDTVRKITGAGTAMVTVTTLAGVEGQTNEVDGDGASARFNLPNAIAIDHDGALIVNDAYTVRRVSTSGRTTTIAGFASQRGSADGVGADARFYSLAAAGGLLRDANGDMLVSDSVNATIRRVSASGVTSTVAGRAGAHAIVDGPAASARFDAPSALARDQAGNLYVGDGTTIRKIAPDGVVSTFAGVPRTLALVNGTLATARFGTVGPMVVGADGVLYVVDYALYTTPVTLRRILPDGTVQSVATLDSSVGALVRDANDNLYASLPALSRIDVISARGGVRVLAGKTFATDYIDGLAAVARINAPGAMVFNGATGTLLVMDAKDGLLREVGLDGSVRTLAGTRGQIGMGATRAVAGTLPRASTLALAAPKVLVMGSGPGLVELILP